MKIFEFKKSKYPIFKICFIILVLCGFLSTFSTIIRNIQQLGNVGTYQTAYEPISINLEYKQRIAKNPSLVCFEDYCTDFLTDAFHNNFFVSFNEENSDFFTKKINNILILMPEKSNYINQINQIIIQVGSKDYHYKTDEIKNFPIKEVNFKEDKTNETVKFKAIVLPKVNNHKGFLKQCEIIILYMIYNWEIFLPCYFTFFLAFLVYLYKKDEIDLKFINSIDKKVACYCFLTLAILLGAFLRFNYISYQPLFLDEIHSVFDGLKNSPLFYLLELTFNKLFLNNVFFLRLLPCIFSVFTIYMTYLLFKKFDKPFAILASFLMSISIANIFFSQVALNYSLANLLGISLIYFLYEYINKQDNKNLIIYSLLALLSIYTNYIFAIFAFSNLIWGIFSLIDFKNIKGTSKKSVKFLVANLIVILLSSPYLFYLFNSIKPIKYSSVLSIKQFMLEYIPNPLIFKVLALVGIIYLILIYLPNVIKNKFKISINSKKEDLFLYLTYSICLISIFIYGINNLLTPIYSHKLVAILYFLPFLMIILIAFGILEKTDNKHFIALKTTFSITILLTFFLVSKPITLDKPIQFENLVNLCINDSKLNDYEINVISFLDKKFLYLYPQLKEIKNLNWHNLDYKNGKYFKKIKKNDWSKQKNVVFYTDDNTSNIEESSNFNPNFRQYLKNTTSVIKLIYN